MQLLTRKQVADMLSVSPRTADKFLAYWRVNCGLRVWGEGKLLRYFSSDIDRILEAAASGGASAAAS